MPTIVVTRHGLTTRSVPEQHLGQRIDVGLSADGRAQAAALAERIAGAPFARIITSPLRRAVETARAISAGADVPRPPIEPDRRLLEMDYGAWEGLTYEEIEATDGPRRRAWEADPAGLACPGGESGNDVAARVSGLLSDVLEAARASAGPVLLVGHSTVNRVLACLVLGVPVGQYRRRFVQGQVNLTAFEWRPDDLALDAASALLLNDLGHVRRPPELPWG